MRWRARLAAVLAVSAVVIGLVGAAEWWVLPAALGLPRESYLLGFVASDEQVADVPINAIGLTGALPDAAPDGAIRVLTLGGSSLFNRRMTERLAARLDAEAERPVSVLGAALRAHTSWSSVHKYRYLRHHEFDVVLVYHGINDLFANHVAPEDFRVDYAHLGSWYRRGPLLDRSVIARLVYERLLYRKPERVALAAGFASAAVFRDNLEWLVDAVRDDGGTPVLATFAWSIPRGYSYDAFQAGRLGYNNPERYDRCAVEVWGPVTWVREGIARHNLAVHEVAAARDVLLLDAERELGRDLHRFGDVCHLSEPGTDDFVELLARFLAEAGLLR